MHVDEPIVRMFLRCLINMFYFKFLKFSVQGF